jgi:peptide/nickel transport system ATP-binding protein
VENITHKYINSVGDKHVLNGVSIEVGEKQTVGLLGQSGSGKTTLGQIVTGLLRPTEGMVYFHGVPVRMPYRGDVRRKVQILFQHPEVSFNPRLTVYQSLKEIYKLYKLDFSKEILLDMLERFGIFNEHIDRYPAQLSGGELQRISLARILLPQPELIVLDEPTSMLDVISQAQIMRMLSELQEERRISYLLITHDLQLCRHVSDRTYIIDNGNTLEEE